jgi:hypothetical protein
MLIPIDIVWTDKDLKINHIEQNIQPCVTNQCFLYKPLSPSQYVLEIQAGLSQELDMKIGDKLYFKK